MKTFKIKYYEIERDNDSGEQYDELVEEEIKAYSLKIENHMAIFYKDQSLAIKAAYSNFVSIREE